MSTRSSIIYVPETEEHLYFEMLDASYVFDIDLSLIRVSISHGKMRIEIPENAPLHKHISRLKYINPSK